MKSQNEVTKDSMYKACYTHFMYGGSSVNPWSGSTPTSGYMVGRNDLAETIKVQSLYNPDMTALNLPAIQVPRQQYCSELAIAWTIQMKAILDLPQQHLRWKLFVGTWDNKEGETEVDIAQHFEDRDEALAKCKYLREKCVWDIDNNKEIYV